MDILLNTTAGFLASIEETLLPQSVLQSIFLSSKICSKDSCEEWDSNWWQHGFFMASSEGVNSEASIEPCHPCYHHSYKQLLYGLSPIP